MQRSLHNILPSLRLYLYLPCFIPLKTALNWGRWGRFCVGKSCAPIWLSLYVFLSLYKIDYGGAVYHILGAKLKSDFPNKSLDAPNCPQHYLSTSTLQKPLGIPLQKSIKSDAKISVDLQELWDCIWNQGKEGLTPSKRASKEVRNSTSWQTEQ